MFTLVRRALTSALALAVLAVALTTQMAAPVAAATAIAREPMLFGLSDHWEHDYVKDDGQLGAQQGIYGTFFNWSTVAPSSGINFFNWARATAAACQWSPWTHLPEAT